MQTSQDCASTSTKCIPHDFPPLPKCFLHLLSNDPNVEGQTGQSGDHHTNGVAQKNTGDRVVFKSESIASTASDSNTSSSPITVTESSVKLLSRQSSKKTTDKNVQSENVDNKGQESERERVGPAAVCTSDRKKQQILGKLNSSLSKLKREMTDLRSLDVSLLFQLLSLHEAIQDFKMTVWDRYSETGSEYSLETASYMGSMSSLSEEDSDWMEGLQSKGLEDSQVFDQSASSLLDQITALVKKADADF